jgi:hypothetical protein
MNLLIEVNTRLEKYKLSLEKTPEKKDIIQKEIDFLMKIKNDFIELKDDLINFHDLVFLADFEGKPRYDDLQDIRRKFKDKYPNFDSTVLKNSTKELNIELLLDHLTQLFNKISANKAYFETQNNEKRVKECEKEQYSILFIMNQVAFLIHLVQVCKFSLEYSFHIELMNMFL